MVRLPKHKSYMLFGPGFLLRRIQSGVTASAPVAYIHQDDYYIIGMIEKGTARVFIDFAAHQFAQGDLIVVQPGQAHCVKEAEGVEGWLLFADSSYVGEEERRVFDSLVSAGPAFRVRETQMAPLRQLVSILADRSEAGTDKLTQATTRWLATALIGMTAEILQEARPPQIVQNGRHAEIVAAFRQLLSQQISSSRSPSHYAAQLNISCSYLNEAVKETTGMSTSSYIKEELVLQAKRQLAHTSLSVKEISSALGIDDHAYFSRLFVQTTGITPSEFRSRNPE